MKFDAADMRQRVGGRYMVSWLIVVGSAPFLVPGFIATEGRAATTVEQLVGIASVAMVGQLVIAALFGLGAVSIFRDRHIRPVPLWAALVFYGVVGEIRMVTLVVGLEFIGVDHAFPLWSRFLVSGVLFPVAFGFSAYSLESLRRYRDRRAQLVASIVDAEVDLERQAQAVESLRQAFLVSVDEEITQVNTETAEQFDLLANRIVQGEDTRPDLAALMAQSDARWRAISHSTWQSANIDVPNAGVREFVDTLVRSRPLSAWAVIFGSLFVFSLGLARSFDVGFALGATLVWFIVTALLITVVNELGARTRVGGLWVFWTGFAAVVFAGLGFLGLPGVSPEEVIGAIAMHVTVVLTALSVGAGPALAKNQQLVLDALGRHLDASTVKQLRVESELVVLAQKVAARLHGQSRGYFLAHVLRLQRALDAGEVEGALEEIAKIRAGLLDDRIDGSDEPDRGRELTRFLDNWKSLVSIETSIDLSQLDSSTTQTVVSLVIEAVNDAVRHGRADWISVTVSRLDRSTEVTVVNNGSDAQPGAPGLGSQSLDRIAPGAWSRTRDDEGNMRLQVTIVRPGGGSADPRVGDA